MRSAAPVIALIGLMLSACSGTLSPLKNKIDVGKDDFLIFSGTGPDGSRDLFAVLASGGPVFQVTFTRLDEEAPALTGNGDVVAFIRTAPGVARAGSQVWLMNLLNGADRELPLPEAAGPPERLGWSRDQTALYVRTANGTYRVSTPPAPALAVAVEAHSPAADSALDVLLGDPPAARAEPCDGGVGICAVLSSGEKQVLDSAGRHATRWGPDSVAYLLGSEIVVQPLAGGKTRRVLWKGPPSDPRDFSYASAPGR